MQILRVRYIEPSAFETDDHEAAASTGATAHALPGAPTEPTGGAESADPAETAASDSLLTPPWSLGYRPAKTKSTVVRAREAAPAQVRDLGTIAEAISLIAAHDAGFVWASVANPGAGDLDELAAGFGLHDLAVEDAVLAHQRPKLERYGDTLFLVLRPALYAKGSERINFAEVHQFIGRRFALTVHHGDADVAAEWDARIEANRVSMGHGPEGVMYGYLDETVDGYEPVVAVLNDDVDEIEEQVFAAEGADVSKRTYQLMRETITFGRATEPLPRMLEQLSSGFDKYEVPIELQRILRDIHDHVSVVQERIHGFHQLLQNILQVNSTLIGQRQNDTMAEATEASLKQAVQSRKIGAWAGILFVPSMFAGIWGMNFSVMPELHFAWGYPAALSTMALSGVVMWRVFKRNGWL